jgi:hypothetical protein
MSLTIKFIRHRVDSLALIGGFIILSDSIWGVIATLGLDWNRGNELVMGISFVLGFPSYLFDLWINKRIAISLLGLFLFRWIATCFVDQLQFFVALGAVAYCLSWRSFFFSCLSYGGKGISGKVHIRPENPPLYS